MITKSLPAATAETVSIITSMRGCLSLYRVEVSSRLHRSRERVGLKNSFRHPRSLVSAVLLFLGVRKNNHADDRGFSSLAMDEEKDRSLDDHAFFGALRSA